MVTYKYLPQLQSNKCMHNLVRTPKTIDAVLLQQTTLHSWPPQKNICSRLDSKIHISFDFMGDKSTKWAANNTIPTTFMISIKFLSNEICDCGMDISGSYSEGKRVSCGFDSISAPFIGHVLSKYLSRVHFLCVFRGCLCLSGVVFLICHDWYTIQVWCLSRNEI